MTKEEIEKKLGKPILKWVGIVQGIFLLILIFSPLCLIWSSWSFTLKIWLTASCGVLLTAGVYAFIKFIIKAVVNDYFA